jgi:hypothetical protein
MWLGEGDVAVAGLVNFAGDGEQQKLLAPRWI